MARLLSLGRIGTPRLSMNGHDFDYVPRDGGGYHCANKIIVEAELGPHHLMGKTAGFYDPDVESRRRGSPELLAAWRATSDGKDAICKTLAHALCFLALGGSSHEILRVESLLILD